MSRWRYYALSIKQPQTSIDSNLSLTAAADWCTGHYINVWINKAVIVIIASSAKKWSVTVYSGSDVYAAETTVVFQRDQFSIWWLSYSLRLDQSVVNLRSRCTSLLFVFHNVPSFSAIICKSIYSLWCKLNLKNCDNSLVQAFYCLTYACYRRFLTVGVTVFLVCFMYILLGFLSLYSMGFEPAIEFK